VALRKILETRMAIPEKATAEITSTIRDEAPIGKLICTNIMILWGVRSGEK
jgi:hypothetical protein